MDFIRILLEEKDLEMANQFATDRANLSYEQYSRRGQSCLDRIKSDIVTGALGELAAFKLLDKFMDVEHPDFRVYEKRKKSWAPDLVNKEGIRFHCKSQSKASRKKYGPSHILQYGGSGHGHVDKLFTNRTAQDYLISCQVNQEKMYVDVYGAFQVDLIFEKDFIKMPKNEWFKDTKRAIYLEDLTDLPYNDKWGIVFGEEK